MNALTHCVHWAFDNPIYGFGALIGLVLGVFYGFDGWRGSSEELDFKDSPRPKNFKWLLTGALSTILGDVKAVDAGASKPLLLLVYCACALLGALFIVAGWGLLVAVDSLLHQRRLGYDYGTIDAVGDYFYFGYRRYKRVKDERVQEQSRSRDYLKQLTDTITIAGSRIPPNQHPEFARNFLQSITIMVRRYRGDKTPADIRTNLMLVRDCTVELAARIKFIQPGARVARCLVLVAYDRETLQTGLVLPLPTEEAEFTVPGAPAALKYDATAIVDDTRSMTFENGTPDVIKKAIESYFASKSKSFRSFASFPIAAGGQQVAVINVDCSEPNVFGSSAEDKRRVIERVSPFATALGVFLSQRQE